MIIDCDLCAMQHSAACADCVVSVLLHKMGEPVVLSSDERVALGNLSAAGMVAPLRLVPKPLEDSDPSGGEIAAG